MNQRFRKTLSNLDKYRDPRAKAGTQFEHKVMSYLRKCGWHTMRRTFSWGVVFCSECGTNTSRQTKQCSTCGSKTTVLHASLDLTAYKDGVYLMITCKSSKQGRTTYMTDPLWQNMVPFANIYGAIPTFAGNTAEGKIHFTNLLTLKPFKDSFFNKPLTNIAEEMSPLPLTHTYKHPSTKATADPNEVRRMKEELWRVVDEVNKLIEESPDMSASDKAKLYANKVAALNQINKYIGNAGVATEQDDFAKKLSEFNLKNKETQK